MVDDEDLYEDDEGEDDEGDDEPSAVFVGMAYGRDGTEDAFKMIGSVCDRLGLEPLRVQRGTAPGSSGGDNAVRALLEEADFAILDLSHKRPTIAREIEMIDRELDPAFVLFIACAGTPPIPELQDRVLNTYTDKGDLRAVVERCLNTMIDIWHESEEEDDE